MAEIIPILRVIDAGAVVSTGGSAIEDLSAFARRASASQPGTTIRNSSPP
jgi:hypothetical protein